MAEADHVEEVPLLQFDLAADHRGLGLFVPLDQHVPHPGLQNPDPDVPALDVHVRNPHHDVAGLVVELLNPIEVVAEEDAVEDRPDLGEDLLHQGLVLIDGVAAKGNRVDHRVFPDGVDDRDPLALRPQVHVHIGEEPLAVYGLDILLERIPIQGGARLRLDNPQDVRLRDLLVSGHADGLDPRRLGRKDAPAERKKAEPGQREDPEKPPQPLPHSPNQTIVQTVIQRPPSPFPCLRSTAITGLSFFKTRSPV